MITPRTKDQDLASAKKGATLTMEQMEIAAADGATGNFEDDISILEDLGLVGFHCS